MTTASTPRTGRTRGKQPTNAAPAGVAVGLVDTEPNRDVQPHDAIITAVQRRTR
jgi:hypothetical protein